MKKTKALARDLDSWHEWASLADDFLIAFALLIDGPHVPRLFMVGHALELTLKAVHAKHAPNKPASNHGHAISTLLDSAHKNLNILSSFHIPQSTIDRMKSGTFQKEIGETMSKRSNFETPGPNEDPEIASYLKFSELHQVVAFLSDIKYLYTEHKQIPRDLAISGYITSLSPAGEIGGDAGQWAAMFREMFTYLGWPVSGWHDKVKAELKHHIGPNARPRLSEFGIRFLELSRGVAYEQSILHKVRRDGAGYGRPR